MVSFPQVSPPKHCSHLSLPPYMPGYPLSYFGFSWFSSVTLSESVTAFLLIQCNDKNQHCVLRTKGILRASLQARGWTIWVSNLGRKRFVCSPNFPDRLWSPSSPVLNGYWRALPEVKLPAREVNQSSPCSVEFTNEWSYTPNFLIWFHGSDRGNWQTAKHLLGGRTSITKKNARTKWNTHSISNKFSLPPRKALTICETYSSKGTRNNTLCVVFLTYFISWQEGN